MEFALNLQYKPVVKRYVMQSSRYLHELDFIKGIMIVLVVAFHLVFIGNTYPYAKQVVYTFHMPCFLIISGYLMKTDKTPEGFLSTLMRFALPYLIIESGYIVMASILPIREHIDNLTVKVFIEKLLQHPLGPYWYLYTLFMCGITYYCIDRCLVKLNVLVRLMIVGAVFYFYTHVLNIMSFSGTMFFLLGALVNKSRWLFTGVFRASVVSFIVFAVLIMFPENLNRESLGGLVIIYSAMSMCLFVYRYAGGKFRNIVLYLGRNSLLIFLFSPIFTILCKFALPYLLWDKTGMVYLLFSLAFCIAGSLLIGFLLDKLKLSRYIIGKPIALSKMQ